MFISRTQAIRALARLPISARYGHPAAIRSLRSYSTATTQKVSPQSLAQIIEDTITATGPVSVARYMQLCLTHPTLGYYSQGDVFGEKGDFVTSPEISQIFGELVAVWLMTRWLAAGSPASCRIVELGPGRGTLMDDILRTFLRFGKPSIKTIHLVENSANLQDVQRQKLSARAKDLGAELVWNEQVEVIPQSDDFTFVVAHEFFDAMPIHILQRTEEGFREVKVGKNASYVPSTSSPRFSLGIDREQSFMSSLLPASSTRFSNLPVGSQIEVSPESSRIVHSVGNLMNNGGAGLVVDYGGDKAFSSSFRAFRKHKIVDVFDEPGSSDLTANVDFAYLRESLEGVATCYGPISQASFLLALGLEPRLTSLLSSAADDPDKQRRIRRGAQRLIDEMGMGSQYQVMAFANGPAAEGDVYPFGTMGDAPTKATP
ncbi:Protein arginine methyltransferase NDUFAF7, mitochondrial [Vanrija pseudolonga]|uniref:Protein arginine methyltransferase NDUFAF7 n=1 Tax=Vanrija pseudolonga TaxID=143232 RepID=A0AAF0YLA3_9TREE|nr:Protein arginine methyltransferase NDUFAF7, mitochondrial [Vanrija pseudolonga]